MARVEFVGQSRRDSDSPQVEPARLINLYREVSGSTRTTAVLKSVLGTTSKVELPNVFMRAMRVIGGKLYVVLGGKLYRVSKDWTFAEVLSDPEGPEVSIPESARTTITGNNGSICIAAGGEYFVDDGEGLKTVSTGAFSSVGSVEFIGQRTILTERNGRRVQWSAVADAANFDALDFSTTESTDDNNIRGLVINGNYWIFKEGHIEVWALTGGTDFIAPVGNTIDVGLKAFRLVSKFPDGAFFVGSDGIVYITNGGNIAPVSTTAVEADIENATPTDVVYYEDKGHKIACIRFSDRPAWCYDLSTREWHERALGPTHEPWDVVTTVRAWGVWLAGNDLGNVMSLTRNNVDVQGPMVRTAVSQTLEAGKASVSRLEVFAEMGEGSNVQDVPLTVFHEGQAVQTEAGQNLTSAVVPFEVPPMCWLEISKDQGRTWSQEIFRHFGASGDYRHTAVWRALGRSTRTGRFVFRLSVSDPVDRSIYSVCDVELA